MADIDPTNLPERIVIGKNGAYWRDFGDYYSMAVVSTDNDPVEPIAVYVRDAAAPQALLNWFLFGLEAAGPEGSLNLDHRWWRDKARTLAAEQPTPERDGGLADAESMREALETWRYVAEKRLAVAAVPDWLSLLPMTLAALSKIVTTDLGRFRAVTSAGVLTWLFECPGCGTWAHLDDDQWTGRVSVDHAADGCAGGYHETHDYQAALRARVIAGRLTEEAESSIFAEDDPEPSR